MVWECVILRELKCTNCGAVVEEIDVDGNKTYWKGTQKIKVVNRECPICNFRMEEGAVGIVHRDYLNVDYWMKLYDYMEPEAARSLAEDNVKSAKKTIDRLKRLGVIS